MTNVPVELRVFFLIAPLQPLIFGSQELTEVEGVQVEIQYPPHHELTDAGFDIQGGGTRNDYLDTGYRIVYEFQFLPSVHGVLKLVDE
jgi:hypothetical protein